MIQEYSRELHHEFYKDVSQSHGWPILPDEYLSPIGFVSVLDNKYCAIVFVYHTVHSKWGVMEWLFVSKEIPKDKRTEAINEVVDAAKSYADSQRLTLFTSCKGAKLISRYNNAGFTQTETGMTNFIYRGQ